MQFKQEEVVNRILKNKLELLKLEKQCSICRKQLLNDDQFFHKNCKDNHLTCYMNHHLLQELKKETLKKELEIMESCHYYKFN